MEYNWQSATKLNVVKDVIMLVTYFLNGPMFNLLFSCHIDMRESDFLWDI